MHKYQRWTYWSCRYGRERPAVTAAIVRRFPNDTQVSFLMPTPQFGLALRRRFAQCPCSITGVLAGLTKIDDVRLYQISNVMVG